MQDRQGTTPVGGGGPHRSQEHAVIITQFRLLTWEAELLQPIRLLPFRCNGEAYAWDWHMYVRSVPLSLGLASTCKIQSILSLATHELQHRRPYIVPALGELYFPYTR